MKVIGISGSPRKKGNTATMVLSALDSARSCGCETIMVYLSDYSIGGCSGCEACRETYKCVINDDMQKLYPELLEADAIIAGSPTYFYNMTSLMKAFIERLYCFEIFDKNNRAVWMSVNEALGSKLALVIAICEQNHEEYMGFTSKAMSSSFACLGYRIVESIEILNLYDTKKSQAHTIAIEKAKNGGEKLAKTLLLKKEIVEKYNKKI